MEAPKTCSANDEAQKPYSGRSSKPILELCSRNLPRSMYPLMIHLCYFCQKLTSERDCFIMENGRVYLTVQMCPRCVEYNKATQEAGKKVLEKQLAERALFSNDKNSDPQPPSLLFS